MAKETVQEKAQRLYESGAVTQVSEDEYTVQGSSPQPYRVKRGRLYLFCSCPA